VFAVRSSHKVILPDVSPSGTMSQNAEGAAMVLAEGEASGHCHAIRERVTMVRDDSLPRERWWIDT
jgi:hypothetical protein